MNLLLDFLLFFTPQVILSKSLSKRELWPVAPISNPGEERELPASGFFDTRWKLFGTTMLVVLVTNIPHTPLPLINEKFVLLGFLRLFQK